MIGVAKSSQMFINLRHSTWSYIAGNVFMVAAMKTSNLTPGAAGAVLNS